MRLFRRNKKGFTLIELLVVIAIIGVLASIVTVSTIAILHSAQKRSAATRLNNYWKTTNTLFNQANKGFSTVEPTTKGVISLRLGLNDNDVLLGTSTCTSIPNDDCIYIQYEYNPKSVYNKYKLVCIWLRYEGKYYYTNNGSDCTGPKDSL